MATGMPVRCRHDATRQQRAGKRLSRPMWSCFNNRERKMRTKFFCTNFLNTARGPGHPGKIPGTSRIPLFETQGKQSFEGGHEVFGHHPFAWKTPTPPGGLRTQKLNLCALFSCLKQGVNVALSVRKRLPGRPCKETMYWQCSNANTPLSVIPLLSSA